MKRDWINIKISTQYLDENDEWQDVTIACRARRNEYFNPISDPYEPFLDIESFRCAEYDWLGGEVFEEEITKAFYEAEADGLAYWEDSSAALSERPIAYVGDEYHVFLAGRVNQAYSAFLERCCSGARF